MLKLITLANSTTPAQVPILNLIIQRMLGASIFVQAFDVLPSLIQSSLPVVPAIDQYFDGSTQSEMKIARQSTSVVPKRVHLYRHKRVNANPAKSVTVDIPRETIR